MTSSYPTIYVDQFSNSLHILAQQFDSKLLPFVRPDVETSGDMAFWNRLAKTQARRLESRFQEVVWDDPEFSRVGISSVVNYTTARLSGRDIARGNLDPSAAVMQNLIAALAREYDKSIYACLGADILTGHAAATAVALPSGQKIAVNNHKFDDADDTLTTAVGLTYYKILNGIEKFKSKGIDPVSNNVVLVCTAHQEMDLIKSVRASSVDYITARTMETGSLPAFLGVKLLVVADEVAPALVGGDRLAYMFAEQAVGAAMLSPIQGDVVKAEDNVDVMKFKAFHDCAFTVIDQELVVQITCNV